MKIILKSLLVILIVGTSKVPLLAQNNVDFFADTTQHLTLSFGTDYSYGSSVMNQVFLNKFIFGGKIEREDKDRAYNKLSNKNILGGDLHYKLNIEIPIDTLFGKTNLSFLVGLENVEHVDAEFSSDLFKFAFDGNKQFAGKNAAASINYNYYKYQQFNLGLVNYKNINNQLAKVGVVFSLIKAEEYEAIKDAGGTLFTEKLGKQIDLDLRYNYNSSDTANKGIAAFNGVGAATNIFAEHFFKNGDKIYFGIEDLGFIYWNKNSLEISTDSTFHFDGIVVDNIFDLNDTLLNEFSKDSIVNSLSTTNQKGKYSMALPSAVNINYTKVLNKKWKINVGVYHKILANYFPLIYSNYYYYFNTKFVAKAHVSYGGYGKLNTGLALAKSFNKYVEIYLGTNNIEALIISNSSYSNSGFIGIKAYF